MQRTISASNFANIMGVSKATLQKWETNGTFVPSVDEAGNKFFFIDDLLLVPEINAMVILHGKRKWRSARCVLILPLNFLPVQEVLR